MIGAVVLGAASLLIARPLGYDAWAWMVWGRELLHGNLQLAGGPSFKALPVIAAAPLTPFGDLAPMTWLACMRVCALLSLLIAYRAGSRLGGSPAGAAAAVLVALGPDLYRTAVYGSSEPLLVLLVLLAADRYLAGSPRTALALLGVGGLIRPELWPLVGVLAVVLLSFERRLDPVLLAAALLPPVVWLGMAWAGSGRPLNQVTLAGAPRELCTGCAIAGHWQWLSAAVTVHTRAVVVLQRLTEAIVLPAIALAAVGVIVAARRRRPQALVIAGVAIAWILIVAIMAQAGYPGSRRYLVGPAALLALPAGAGFAIAVRSVHHRLGRVAIAAAIAGLVVLAAYPTLRSDAALVSTARAEQRTASELRRAVGRAGGRVVVLRVGRPAVNPLMQTSLAWDLRVPLAGVQPTWHSTRRAPRWSPPAVVFRGPVHYAGPRPALPRDRPVRPVGRAGVWTIVLA